MKLYHYTKANRLHSIFTDGFIATEMKRSVNTMQKETDYVWFTEKLQYPKTALPAFSLFPETSLSTHLLNKNVHVDLGKIGAVIGNFYRFSFNSEDTRFKKWWHCDERKEALLSDNWRRMESVANKVNDEVRTFWIATKDVQLINFSLEVFENNSWNVVLSNVSLNSASPETMQAIDELKAVSKNLCHEFGLPVYEELQAA